MATHYETVIGLEVHVELATKTKIFCGCPTAFGAAPNTQVCPVCLGLPGALPVLNERVVEKAVLVGLATGCTITETSKMDRKNYFYPDNPQGYQISQLYEPICRDGKVEITTKEGRKQIGIHEIHMEEDAGKLIHEEGTGVSLVDYNRSGVPLIEIVSKPDLRSAEEVIAYLETLRTTIQYLGVSDCKLQEGSMRADVNLSIRPAGTQTLGTRTEMKNLSSFRAITRAIAEESRRQQELLEAGKFVIQETRRWDEQKNVSYSMRSKEDAMDYRYFPEPDLVPIRVSREWVEKLRSQLPEMREAKIERYVNTLGLPRYDAEVLTGERPLAQLFEDTVACGSIPKKVSNWMMGEGIRMMKETQMEASELAFSPKHLAQLIKLVEQGKINGTTAKEVFEHVFREDVDPVDYVERHGLGMTQDLQALQTIIEQVLEENPKSIADYRNGKKQAMGYLIGQTMKATSGKANPALVKQLLLSQLES